MIGYYKIEDVTSGRLRTPSSHAELNTLEISSTLLTPSLFRVPPLVEAGADGQLRYRGEAEQPMSPVARSGSSQGLNNNSGLGSVGLFYSHEPRSISLIFFSSPGFISRDQSRSRPPSSDSAASASPRLPPLSISTSHRDSATPGSPHRLNSSMRNSNRFDPYSTGRSSPNLSYSASGASNYPFPSQQSPNRPTFPPSSNTLDDRTFRSLDISGPAPMSPVMSTMSSSAPSSSHQWAMQHSVGLSRTPASDQSSSTSFYQPQQSTPFPHSGPTSTGGASAGMFSYQPPPPSAYPPPPPSGSARQPPPGRTSPPMPYPQYTPFPPSLHSQHHQPPSSSLPGRPSSSHYLTQQHQPSRSSIASSSSRPYGPSLPQPNLGSSSGYANSGSSSGYPSLDRPSSTSTSLDFNPPPPHHQHQQRPAYDYQPIQHPSDYSRYSAGNQSAYPQIYSNHRALANGMVIGLSGEVDDDARHGLGLGEEQSESQGGSGRAHTIKEEPNDEVDGWSSGWRGPPTPANPETHSRWPPGAKGGYT
ncbi:hypothetical protein P7C70_g9292, partial [Phenoliferia sp. Uapishka_3]